MTDVLRVGEDGVTRCWWPGDDPLYVAYHDKEWGVPSVDDRLLFEHLCLEAFQAGLSWITILRKREDFRRVFHGFDPQAMSRMGPQAVERLMGDASIVRNRLKIESVINNATRCLALQEEVGSLAAFLWSFEADRAAPGRAPEKLDDFLTTSPESLALSKALKKRGWKFVGPTGLYAAMQAIGIVNDHVAGCSCREICLEGRQRLTIP